MFDLVQVKTNYTAVCSLSGVIHHRESVSLVCVCVCVCVCMCVCVCVCVCAVPTFTTLTSPCNDALCSEVSPVSWSSTCAVAPPSISRRAMPDFSRSTAAIPVDTVPSLQPGRKKRKRGLELQRVSECPPTVRRV